MSRGRTRWAHPLVGWCLAATALAQPLPESGGPIHSPGGFPELRFEIDQGNELNRFLRAGPIAAHLQLRSGRPSRLLVAFPAGNSGVALWFESQCGSAQWQVLGSLKPIENEDTRGRALRGIEAELTINCPSLTVREALLGSVRTIRDFQSTRRAPAGVLAGASETHDQILWARDRLDGHAGYSLSIGVLDGGSVRKGVLAGTQGQLRLRLRAMTGEDPLTPLASNALFRPSAEGPLRTRQVLEFLSYREKYLAGSWRFDTYFGRDTLMSLAMLARVLEPQALERGFASVLSRTSVAGEVAHEEGIGEFAVLQNKHAGIAPADRPSYDYSMIDESFMLAPVVAEWLLGGGMSRDRAAEFLRQPSPEGSRMGARLVKNLLWVTRRTAAFARDPAVSNLIGLKPGTSAGEWRDSPDGLGGGRYPYDVNAVFVPAALRGADALLQSGLLQPYLSTAQTRTLEGARAQSAVWIAKARPYFAVKISMAVARSRIAAYARSLSVDPRPALQSLGGSNVTFDALALAADGIPVPVVHSDTGFMLLFDDPMPQQLASMVQTALRPFPTGLWTPVGMVVANPVFADRELRPHFSRTAYHGTVIWSWQQALFAAGLQKQLNRRDLPPAVRSRLLSAQAKLWNSIHRSQQKQTSELWSWSIEHGCFQAEPFLTNADEANAAQLWSTAFLGLTDPHPPVTGLRSLDPSGACPRAFPYPPQ